MSCISSKTTVAQCDLGPISSNRKVVHGVFYKFWLLRIRANLKQNDSCAVFWRKFRAAGQLRTVFWTSFSFLRNVAHFRQNDSCAVWFWANFKQQESCARRFLQVLAFKKTGQFEAKRQLRRVFWRKFWATGQLRTVFCTSFSFLTKGTNFD